MTTEATRDREREQGLILCRQDFVNWEVCRHKIRPDKAYRRRNRAVGGLSAAEQAEEGRTAPCDGGEVMGEPCQRRRRGGLPPVMAEEWRDGTSGAEGGSYNP